MAMLDSHHAPVTRFVPEAQIRQLVGPSFRTIEDGRVLFESQTGTESISLLAFSFSPEVASCIVRYKLFLAESHQQLQRCLAIINQAK
jgi:hypothetical protein